MKQTKKYIITMAALLLSVTTWAQGKFTYIYQLNGSSSTATTAGTISGEISENGTATLTLTPAQGNYINADYITVAKTLSGGNAQTRIGTAENVSITASNANADPSGATTYTFAVEDSKYDYEVTANFQSRTSISSATVTLATTSYTYDGQEHKPTVSSVKLGGTTLATNDYTVSYADDCTNVGTVTVTIAGARTYTGTATATYSINEAAMTVNASGYTGTYDGQAHGITVTAPEGATIKYGTTEGTYNLETSPEYTDAGNYTVYYQVTRTNYQEVTGSATIEIAKATPTITFEKESYSATFGETFNAPTPTTSPEGLTVVATGSSNTQVATVANGAISIIGVGETTITVSFAGNNNYNAATATYILNVAAGTTTGITATGYTGTYDGQAHGITIEAPEGAIIKYGTTEGTYNLETSPEYTDAGNYTVYYQVTRTNYQDVSGSATIEIAKADPSITFDKQSYSATFGETFTAPVASTSPEGLTVVATGSSNTQVATVANGVITITGVGETTITVSFAGNNNYNAATATYTLNVAAGTTTGITATGYTGTYDGQAHGITVTAPEDATIKYGTTEGTYNLETSPEYTDAGNYTVYYQVTRTNYQDVTGSATVEIAKADPTITFDKESYDATFGETFTAPTPTTSPEGLTVVATGSSNTQVATVANGVITITGVGETTITVSFAGNNNYNAATATYTLNVAAGTTTGITATGYTGTYDGQAHGITVNAPQDAVIKYGTTEGTYNLETSPEYTDAGNYTVYYQVTRTNYQDVIGSATIEIAKADPSITFDKQSYSATFGETFTAPTASTNPEGLTVVATGSSNTQVATVANGVITIAGVGETTITVSFAGNNNYNAATATYTLNVAAGTTTGITATGYTGTYDGQAHSITVSAPEDATIKYGTTEGTYNLETSPEYTDAGNYTVYYQVTRTNYQAVTGSATVEIAKATPSITFDKQSYSATYGEAFTAPVASTNPEGLTVVATGSSNTQVATVADGVITIAGVGETNITVSFAGNNNYNSSTATYILNVAAGTTTGVTATGYTGTYDGQAHGITVNAPQDAVIKYGTTEGTYNLETSPEYTDAGNYTVYYQVTRTNYQAVTGSAIVEIAKANPSITFDKESYSATFGEAFTAPVASTSPEGLTVVATGSSNTQVATVANGAISIIGVGETTITVSFAGNNNYNAATATYTLNVAAGTTTGITATGYTGTYDGQAHGITVSVPEDATIKYGTTEGTYNLETSPEYTDAGNYTIYYQVTRANYQDVTGSATIEIAKADPSITFDKQSYSAIFGETFTAPTASTNPEGLIVVATGSSNTQVATVADGVITIAGVGETNITVSFAGNNNYNAATATYTLNVAVGTTTGITATGYTGTYDGNAHGITVNAPQDATIKYGTTEGNYNLETSPEYTDAGNYTVYYQVTRANYQDVTGSATIEIAKADPSITFDKQSYSAIFGETFTAPTASTNPEGLTVVATGSSNMQVATVANGVITIAGVGETTITVSFAGNNNYNAATATYTLNVAAGTTTGITATGYTGTYDGQAHGITVNAPQDAVIKYGTTEGTYNLETSPEYTDAGNYTVYYQVTRTNYQAVTGSATVEIAKADPSITFEKESYSATFGETFTAPTASTNPEGLTVVATGSSNTQVATVANGAISIIGVGETTITVSFAGNNNYNSSTATYILNVAAGTTTGITATGYTGIYDGLAHGITVAAPQDAIIKYGTTEGTYNLETSPKYTDAGNYTVYYQVTRTNYEAVTGSAAVEITKADPSITFDKQSYSAIFGEAFNAPVASTSPEGLTVNATGSSNTQVATVANGVITIAGVGETTITVSFAGNNNYNAATATYTLNVAAGTTTGITATGYTGTYDGQAHGIIVNAPQDAVIKYGTTEGAYNLDASPEYTDAGNYTIYYQVTRTNYQAVNGSATIEIAKADPSITFDKQSYSATFGETFTAPVASTSPEGLTVVATGSSNTQVATVANGVITIAGVGETTITVSFAGNNNYNAATATYTLNVAAGTTTGITATGYTGTYDGNAHGITVAAPEGATIKYGTTEGTYNLETSPEYTDAGNYTVYYQVTRANYQAVTGSATIEIAKAETSITFDKQSYSATFGETFNAPTPTTSPDGLTVVATGSSNTQVANVANGVITIAGVGETTITVSFAGNNNYNAATATYILNVAAGTTTGITATGYTGTYDGQAHGIIVNAPEGATIKYGTTEGTYNLETSPEYADAGNYTVYYQVTRTNYQDVTGSATIEIAKADPSITFDKESYDATFGEAFTAPTPTTSPEGLTVTATGSSNAQVANVANGVITIAGVGETTITVSFAGNNNYNAATATYTLNVAAGTTTGITATGYTGTYDGNAHGITVTAPEGAIIKYGTTEGTYNLETSPEYTDAGSYTVYYQVTRTNYQAVTGSATVEIAKATPTITFDKQSYSATFGETFTAPTPTTSPEGLTVVATGSSNTQVATVANGAISIIGVGETTITVSFAGNNNYNATTATYTLNVAAGTTTGITATGYTGTYDGNAHGITVNAPQDAVIKYGTTEGTYNLETSPEYTDAGNYTVYYQVTRANYQTVTGSATVEIAKADPTITFDKESYDATFGETFTAPTPTTSPEGLTVTATGSSNTQIATVAAGAISIIGVGETTITVSFAGNNNYNAATATYTLNVAAGTTTGITATGYTGTYDGNAHGITVAAPQDAIIKYGTTEGTYNLETSPEYTDAGNYTVYYQVTRTNYQDVTGSATIEIAKADPSITFDKESYSATFGETFTAPVASTSPEGLTVVATGSSNTQVATVADGAISIIGVGETTITVSFAGNNNYNAATATYTLNVAAGTTTGITATGYTGTYDGQAHSITVSAPEDATIKYGTTEGTYNLDASPEYTDAGNYTVYYQVTRANYQDVTGSATVEIAKADPSITFDKESYSATYGEAFTAPVASTSPEGLTVVATGSSNTQVATVANGAISIIGVGETTITVSFAGNNNYNEATATYILNVAAGTTTEVIATGYTGTYDGNAHGITVAAPQDAVIKYSTTEGTYNLETSPEYTDAGNYTVYYQVTRTNYQDVTGSATVEIAKADPSITFDKQSYSATFGETFTAPTPTTTPEGLTIKTISSSNTQVATVNDGVIKIEGVGETTITVSFAGNNNYNAATATYTLNVAAGTITGVTANGYTVVYDGKAHGITVEAPKGAIIKYGINKGKYNLDKSPTYTDAGTYWIHYQVEQTNYTTIADSAKVEITKATPSITFDKERYSVALDETFTAPTPTTTPEGLTIKTISSSNTQVATVNDGVIKIEGIGETTITVSFAGNVNYKAATASYVLTVKKPKAKTYDLWIGGTQVTEDNAEDVFNQAEDSKQPLYLYNAKNNTLIINRDQRGTAVIESKLPELKVYIMDTCMVKSIYYSNPDNTGTLTFTCNGNYPGELIIENDNGVSAIQGFSDVSYEYNLSPISPISPQYTIVYDKGQMMKETRNANGEVLSTVADSVSIGMYIVPLINGETNTVNKDDCEGKDLTNYSNGKLIFTFQPNSENPDEGDGIDTDENGETGIFIATTMTDEAAGNVANNVENNELTPGGGQYAEDYDGITFMIPAGEGVIMIDQIVDPGYEFHLRIGTEAPATLSTGDQGRVEAKVPYKVEEPTYCYLYMVEAPMSARAAARREHDTRVGKRSQAHGKIFSVTVSPNKVKASNTPAQASGGIIPPSKEQGDEIEIEGIQGVKVVNTVDDRWFTIDGRQIDKPTQKGLYIHNRKKVVVK